MKIRMGFVSNSSSASFILTIGMSKEAFLKLFFETCKSKLNKESIRREIKDSIEEETKYLKKWKSGYEKEKDNKYSMYKLWISQSDLHICSLTGALKRLDGLSDVSMVEEWLHRYGVTLHKKLKNVCEAYAYTLMDNGNEEDFGEGIILVKEVCKKKGVETSEATYGEG